MIDRTESRKRWAAVCEAVDSDEIDKALDLLKEWESVDRLSIEELVQKGLLIQQGSETAAYELEDAKAAFIEALGREQNYPDALIELGFYSWVIENDAKTGLQYFDKAIAAAEKFLAEARHGREQCLEELADLEEED